MLLVPSARLEPLRSQSAFAEMFMFPQITKPVLL